MPRDAADREAVAALLAVSGLSVSPDDLEQIEGIHTRAVRARGIVTAAVQPETEPATTFTVPAPEEVSDERR